MASYEVKPNEEAIVDKYLAQKDEPLFFISWVASLSPGLLPKSAKRFFFYFAFIDFGIFRSSATLSLLFFEEVLLAKACGVQGGSAAGVVVEMVPIFIGLG